MINVKDNYELVNDLLSKNNGLFITPSEYNKYAELASNDLFDTLVGAKNVNKSVYGRNRTLDGRLRNFRINTQLSVTSGLAMLPSNFAFIRSVYYSKDGVPTPLRTVDEDRFAKIFNDPFAKPTLDNPMYTEDAIQIRVFPTSITNVTIEYLRKPTPAKYAFTVVNNRPVYDPVLSVNFDWDSREQNELTMRIVQYAAATMANGNMVQYTEVKQQQE